MPSAADSGRYARLEPRYPGRRLSTDASGLGWSHGHAVTKPSDVPPVAVSVSSAAAASLGTPPRPATRSVTGVDGRAAPADQPVPSRVSSTRAGVATRSCALFADQPNESTTTSVATLAKRQTSPPVNDTIVKFATVSPARKFTVEASGRAPQG